MEIFAKITKMWQKDARIATATLFRKLVTPFWREFGLLYSIYLPKLFFQTNAILKDMTLEIGEHSSCHQFIDEIALNQFWNSEILKLHCLLLHFAIFVKFLKKYD